MPIWDRLKSELDRAGRSAQGALDEGRLQLEVFRVRQKMDKHAQDLGYAVYRARSAGADIAAESYTRLSTELAAVEAELTQLETDLRAARAMRKATVEDGPTPPTSSPPI